jgi:hypothetical protein
VQGGPVRRAADIGSASTLGLGTEGGGELLHLAVQRGLLGAVVPVVHRGTIPLGFGAWCVTKQRLD